MPRLGALFGVTLLLPAAWWSVLILGLATLVPSPPDDHADGFSRRWQPPRVESIRLAGPHPCTGGPAALHATVETRATVLAGPHETRVDVEASFENATPDAEHGRLTPTTERYAVRWPADADSTPTVHVHRFQVPLVGGLGGSYLSVALKSTLDADGQIRTALTEARLVCFAFEDEGG